MASEVVDLNRDLAGLDELEEVPSAGVAGPLSRLWRLSWPKLLALAIVLGAWQLLEASHWRPSYVLPGPRQVLANLWQQSHTGAFYQAVGTTMERALLGFVLAIVIGSVVAVLVARIPALRTGVGSLITGLQTMPSIVWFPLAILVFQLSQAAILFVVVLGAAPAIANGLLSGIDYVPPLLIRAGRVMGARGMRLFQYVVLPAALPAYVAGLKQGWAFAWRSLMAGELLVLIPHHPSLGGILENDQNFNDATGLLATMIVILLIGIIVDALFNRLNNAVRHRWGLVDVH